MTIQLTVNTRAALILAALFAFILAAAIPYAVSLADDGAGRAAVTSTAFTYQGRLVDNGVPAEGQRTLRFTLRSDAVANTAVGAPVTRTLTVENGLFTTILDFGPGAFNGSARWLDVEVQTTPGTFVLLGPRQEITPVPYAQVANHALTAASAETADVATTALNFPEHDHFNETWTGSAFYGLNVENHQTNSTSIWATNRANCPLNGEFCYGLRAIANDSTYAPGRGGIGVRGEGSNTGVWASGGLNGVYGDSLTGWGVAGRTYAPGDQYSGVLGIGTGVGVRGEGATGVHAVGTLTGLHAQATESQGYAIEAEADGPNGRGLAANADGSGGTAIYAGAMGADGTGVSAYANSTGVRGRAFGATGYGVHGLATGVNSVGVYGESPWWAGYFDGAVNVTTTFRADDILPTQSACAGGGCFIGDSVKPWTAVHAASYPAVSDARKKKDITNLEYGLAQILALRPVSYSWVDTDSGEQRLGLIAQEVETIIPEVVSVPESEDAFYALDYTELVPVLIKAIQEQQARIEALEAKVTALSEEE